MSGTVMRPGAGLAVQGELGVWRTGRALLSFRARGNGSFPKHCKLSRACLSSPPNYLAFTESVGDGACWQVRRGVWKVPVPASQPGWDWLMTLVKVWPVSHIKALPLSAPSPMLVKASLVGKRDRWGNLETRVFRHCSVFIAQWKRTRGLIL